MRIGIAVFAYNRSRHLQSVLNGLKQNQRVDSLYIFQDGLKCEAHRCEWERTAEVIRSVDWCEPRVVKRETNMGLSGSIVAGIDYVLKEAEAVIVLEDDCVPHPDFVEFMRACFEKYHDNRQIYSVSGYAWPSEVSAKGKPDACFCQRICSWGWGTWKDRWREYEQDYTLLRKIKRDGPASERLAFWGNDLEQMLISTLKGQTDSWAVFWALKVIERNGLCLNPYKSLIRNIGMDGTGVHSGTTERFAVNPLQGRKEDFQLPEEIVCDPDLMYSFIFAGPLVKRNSTAEYPGTVLVYGIGWSFQEHKNRIGERYQIAALIDRDKRGWTDGMQIFAPEKMQDCRYDAVIIMNKELENSLQISHELMENYGIMPEKIRLGCILFDEEWITRHSVTADGTCHIGVGDTEITVTDSREVKEAELVFRRRIYDYRLGNGRRDVIVALGNSNRIRDAFFRHRREETSVCSYSMAGCGKIRELAERCADCNFIFCLENMEDAENVFLKLCDGKLLERVRLFLVRTNDPKAGRIFRRFGLNHIYRNVNNMEKMYFAWSD